MGPSTLLPGLNHRLVHQRSQQAAGLSCCDGLECGDRFDRFQREPASEWSESAEEDLFALAQEVVTPRDCRSETLLARVGGSATGGEKSETIREFGGNLLEPEGPHPGGR